MGVLLYARRQRGVDGLCGCWIIATWVLIYEYKWTMYSICFSIRYQSPYSLCTWDIPLNIEPVHAQVVLLQHSARCVVLGICSERADVPRTLGDPWPNWSCDVANRPLQKAQVKVSPAIKHRKPKVWNICSCHERQRRSTKWTTLSSSRYDIFEGEQKAADSTWALTLPDPQSPSRAAQGPGQRRGQQRRRPAIRRWPRRRATEAVRRQPFCTQADYQWWLL